LHTLYEFHELQVTNNPQKEVMKEDISDGCSHNFL